jgi:Polysaccharide lyase
VPNTGSWNTFQWVGKKGVELTAGIHVLKIVAEQQYFDLNSIRVAVPTTTTSSPPLTSTVPSNATRMLFCTFNTTTDCGFYEHSIHPGGRASLVNFGRDGNTALRLHTEPGDGTTSGTPGAERNDVLIGQAATGCYGGREQWWEHSILFPDDFVVPPPGHWMAVFDFHNEDIQGGQASFQIDAMTNGTLQFRGYGGQLLHWLDHPGEWAAPIGPIVRNTWYDFVYHVKWSSGADGFFKAWVNGVQVVDRTGPTLYRSTNGSQTIGAYLKLANYHSAFGQPTSVIHDRVIRYDVP